MSEKIFFAGTGNMGGAILRGLLKAGTNPSTIFFFDPSDKAAAELRKMLGKDAKPQANGYGGITNAVQNAAKAKSKDSAKKAQADNGEIGRSIMKERNPHYANK